MAASSGDTALWLHNKLGSTDDLWSGGSICSQLTREKLLSIQDCFPTLQPYVKVKLMLAFLHLPKRNVEEWRAELEEILTMAADDTDQWVAMVGDLLRTFPATGAINMQVDEAHRFYHDILTDLRKLVKKSAEVGMLPLECLYLSRTALMSVAGQQPQPVKHFALKRKPKSAALRAELLQKSAEVANTLRKTGGSTTLPIKVRSFAKKMDDTTPLKGLPSRTPMSGGFRSPGAGMSRFGGSTAPGPRTPSGRKEGGIKLLDITEQPVGPKEAKRRRKIAEAEAAEMQKKEKEAASATPDYAAGLVNPVITNLAPANVQGATVVNYTPASVTRLPGANNPGTTTLPTGTISVTTQQARDNLQQQLQQQQQRAAIQSSQATLVVTTQPSSQGPTTQTLQVVTTNAQVVQSVVVTQPAVPNQPAAMQPTQQPMQTHIVQQAPTQAKKGLSLTRQQMVEAQEMFRTSNKVTRTEKALILGFMAGSRDNPCPQQGDIVNIRLSETHESIQQPDATFLPMVVDVYFQMNYSTGEWKRIKKYRERELD